MYYFLNNKQALSHPTFRSQWQTKMSYPGGYYLAYPAFLLYRLVPIMAIGRVVRLKAINACNKFVVIRFTESINELCFVSERKSHFR